MTTETKAIEKWTNVPDAMRDINNGKELKKFEPFHINPIITTIHGLPVLIWMYEDNQISLQIHNPWDMNEGWSYGGPLPTGYTFTKLFKIFDKSPEGRCALQFKHEDRERMRLVIWKKHEPNVVEHVFPFTSMSENPTQILQMVVQYLIAKECRDGLRKQKRKLDSDLESLMRKVMGKAKHHSSDDD